MRHESMRFLALTVILSIVSSFAFAAVPGEFHVQGRLTDASNVVVPDGDYSITFSIWDDPTAGTMLSSQTMLVPTSDGLFSVTLSVAVDIFHTSTPGSRYLQYQILGQLPIQPRTLLTATPYSMISSRVSGDLETGEGQLTVRRGSVSASNFRMIGDNDADQFTVEAKSDSTKVRIIRHSSGDPDFDLLRIQGSTGTGTTPSSSIHLTGDPDFDLLRMSATPDSAKIRISGQSSGDPDFDLLRIVGGGTGGSQGATFAIGGDPDFDLLRITGGIDNSGGTPVSSSSISMGGDPDFDLLRMSATADSAKIRISGQSSGDPDFDLLRIAAGGGPTTGSAEIAMGGDPDFDLLRLSADADSASIRVGSSFYLDGTRSSDDGVVRTFSWRQTGGPWVTRMEQSADSMGSSAHFAGKKGYDGYMISNHLKASVYIEDSTDNVTIEMHGEGRLGVGKAADNIKRIDVAGGAFCDGSNWVNASDVNSKENFSPVDAAALLDKISQLDITEWNYRGETAQARHIGPTAQDFNRIFGVGNDNISISTIDPAGISLAAIKELYKKSKEVDQLKLQIELLSRQVQLLQEQIDKK